MTKKRTGGVVFENEKYKISQEPLNYVIDFKILSDEVRHGKRVKLVPERHYSPVGRGLKEAEALAELMIKLKLEEKP